MAIEKKGRIRILKGSKGDIFDIEFKKGEDLGKAVKEVEEELNMLGVTGFEKLTEEDRKEMREITKNLGYTELKEDKVKDIYNRMDQEAKNTSK